MALREIVKLYRVTRNRDVGDVNEVVINNYVDTGEKRQGMPPPPVHPHSCLSLVWPRVVPPNGLKRQPFKPPRGELEKEKDKLKINMVGKGIEGITRKYRSGQRRRLQ